MIKKLCELYRDRVGGGVGSLRLKMVVGGGEGPLDRKQIINDALDKHLEKLIKKLCELYRDRVGGGVGSSRSEMVVGGGGGPLDQKRIINNALNKHLEKSSPSTSRVGSGINSSSKDKERISVPSTSTGKSQQH